MTPIELYQQALEQRRQGPVKPFSVTEVPHSNMQIPKNGCIFVGWSESRISNAVLSVPVAARPGGALVIVALEKND